ncbi:hypothetical protein NL676_032740 [Syzygium grande]|nr:hypothetical protein NL676_032740 [Syzygium grande]
MVDARQRGSWAAARTVARQAPLASDGNTAQRERLIGVASVMAALLFGHRMSYRCRERTSQPSTMVMLPAKAHKAMPGSRESDERGTTGRTF